MKPETPGLFRHSDTRNQVGDWNPRPQVKTFALDAERVEDQNLS